MMRDSIFVCHRSRVEKEGRVDKPIYCEPTEYEAVVAPVNGTLEISAYGERVFKMYTASLDVAKAKLFKEGDLVYYEITPPYEEHEIEPLDKIKQIVKVFTEPYGEEANYKVVSIRKFSVKSVIYFERLP